MKRIPIYAMAVSLLLSIIDATTLAQEHQLDIDECPGPGCPANRPPLEPVRDVSPDQYLQREIELLEREKRLLELEAERVRERPRDSE